MKQIIQSFKTGETILEDVPAPLAGAGMVLIRTSKSLVSLGTERMLVEFGKSNLISKARQQPDKVKQVLNKIKTDGLIPTFEAVVNKLGDPLPLGYCNVGTVVEVGAGVSEFKVGDRVASNGHHAEFVSIPTNLVASIPDGVSDEEATFTVIGSIGLQGIRLLNPTLGETVVVMGLGLIGLVTAQLLLANGCRVIGCDLDESKLAMAKEWGVIPFNPSKGDVVKFVQDQTSAIGCDGVVITASSKGSHIISQAARMSRKRGRIILVGVIGLDISRSDFYEKELSFQVSCSYGPGRYDERYEKGGIDYPIGFVRWTEKRNFEAVLQAIASRRLLVRNLITEVVELHDYLKIYSNIGQKQAIASILNYRQDSIPGSILTIKNVSFQSSNAVLGIIGAGNFVKTTMMPILKDIGGHLKSIASNSGVSGTTLARKYQIANSTTDYLNLLNDSEIDLILITTRHDLHAKMVVESLNAGKNVFVEKPLALNTCELEKILKAQQESGKTLTVGFNRRFSPHSEKINDILGGRLMNVVVTINAGFIPADFWVHDMRIGGGRIIGEACHFIDLISYFTGSFVKAVCMNAMGKNAEENTDNASILLKYQNGSTGVINYFANGSKKYPKERVEIYSQESTIVLDNFRVTTGYGTKRFSKLKTSLDKGHRTQFRRLVQKLKEGGNELIPLEDIVNTTKVSFAAIESLKENKWISID